MIHDGFMEEALAEARKGLSEGGVPIGAVLVKGGRILARGRNRRVQDGSSVLHAEIDCLRQAGPVAACRGAVLYTTLMPCLLCAGAAVQMGISKVVAGESETLSGERWLLEAYGIEVEDQDLEECKGLMRTFIAQNRDLWNEELGLSSSGKDNLKDL
jgi:creatinine deaminase